jgi:hypothetical protein
MQDDGDLWVPEVARAEHPIAREVACGGAGSDVAFWADDPKMRDKIELIVWSDYAPEGYESKSVFLSEAEVVEMVEKLNAALKELRSFL